MLKVKNAIERGLDMTKKTNVRSHDDKRAAGRNIKDDVIELESDTYTHFKDLYRRMH